MNLSSTLKALTPLIIMTIITLSCSEDKINRKELVSRHHILNTSKDSLNTLTVGNGNFAYTVDITGMQSFPMNYAGGISLGTFSNWGWHSFDNKQNYQHAQVYKSYQVEDREVTYIHQYTDSSNMEQVECSNWLRENPHRLHLGLIGLEIIKRNGDKISLEDIQNPVQELNLWEGKITSRFEIENIPVLIRTVCHPKLDLLSYQIESELISKGQLFIKLHFPAPSSKWKNEFIFDQNESHQTEIVEQKPQLLTIKRTLDTNNYFTHINIHGEYLKRSQHEILFIPERTENNIEFSCLFSEQKQDSIQYDYPSTESAVAESWEKYWKTGGVVDFSKCTDTRAKELERRVVLSQYLMKVNCSGTLPPQETGLTMNSWYGKFHLEMHWWHSAQFVLWNRSELLENQMQYYSDIKHLAKARAERQGYIGVRWPKMTGPDGIDSPSPIATYLIWQQPHPIWFAEALYQTNDNKQEILNKYQEIVFKTADFMASFTLYDSLKDRYILPPPIIPAQERFKPETTTNPAFELAYWYWGLKTAIAWSERLHIEPNPVWKDVFQKLSKLPTKDGLYLFTEDANDSYENQKYLTDHPIILGCLGMLPETEMIDRAIMHRTFDTVMNAWHWKETWGWDFPLTAMNAAELGEYNIAIDALFMDVQTNTFLLNGHNYQNEGLPIYLPGNGALLTAVAKMCVHNQFPKNGRWNVRWENLWDF